MKTQLTAEQSAELIKRGVSPYKASAIEEYNDAVSKWTHRGQPVFTLTDLLEILPKKIENEYSNYSLRIYFDNQIKEWVTDYYDGYESIHKSVEVELIDCIYSMTRWLADNNYLNKD